MRLILVLGAALALGACGSEDDAAETAGCPAAEGPTEHTGDVAADEVWTGAGSPHLVTGPLRVLDGATLTIEPCADVRIAAGQSIELGLLDTEAHLVAEGTAAQPITFGGQDGARWGALWIRKNATARLAHVTIEDAGATTQFGSKEAALFASGDDLPGSKEMLHADQVTISGAQGPGVHLAGNAAFTATSRGLRITGSGSAVLSSGAGAGSLPSGFYTGNVVDEIAIHSYSEIAEAVVWADHGVPYHLLGIPGSYLRIASAESANAALTLEAGVEVRFAKGTYLWIGDGLASAPAYGTLQALGTVEAPVVFTSAEEAPAPGDWIGLQFRGGDISPNNRIEHARIEYAGADCGCVSQSCADEQEAAVLFLGVAPTDEFISETAVLHSAGHGITRGWSLRDHPGVTTSFLDGNVFENVAGCRETLYRDEGNACPSPAPCP